MKKNITERQTEILLAIIHECMITAMPVGSVIICEKYHIAASPATVRNEMVELAEMGFLEKTHFSAGRLPTALGFRYYIERLMHEEELDYMDEVEIRQSLHGLRFQRDRLLKRAVEELAESVQTAAIAVSEESVFYAGLSELLNYQEFQDILKLKGILSIIEDYDLIQRIFRIPAEESGIKVLVGDEAGFDAFEPCAIVYSEFTFFQGGVGVIGAIGPVRMNYSHIIPRVRFTAQTLSIVTRGW